MLTFQEPETGFKIMSIHRMNAGGRWRTEAMRSYARPVLLWFTRGQGKITIAGTSRGYGAHNAVFLPPNTMHGFDMLGTVQGTAVQFPRSMTHDFPDSPRHLRLRDASLQNEMTGLVEALEREARNDRPGAERAMAHHAGLIAIWLERNAALAEMPNEAGAAARLATAFTALVEREFRSGLNVAGYAAQLGVTPTHLSRACRAASGHSASRLLQDRRLYEARKLLGDTALPVSEIAKRLGFRSAAYFSRAFQQKTGSTPSAFRKAA